MSVPPWLRQSWWDRRGFELGARLAEDHPREMAMFVYVLCVVIVGLSLAQAVLHWHDSRSIVSVGIGLVAGAGLTSRVASLHGRGTPNAPAERVASLLGAAAVIPTLGFLQVAEPGDVLGVTQGLADGYIAAMFVVAILFIHRPKDGRTSV